MDYRNKTIEQYCLNNNPYKLNKKYSGDESCTLVLYPQVSFIVNDIFKMFANE